MAINELSIPPRATEDPKARELLRVWAANGKQHITLASEAWSDPACWGIALADLARHLAHAYQLNANLNPQDTLIRIKSAFDAEWGFPTDTVSGHLLNE